MQLLESRHTQFKIIEVASLSKFCREKQFQLVCKIGNFIQYER